MDNTIIEMFKEKNDQILVEKLLIDVDNNDDSLKLTIKNKIELVVSGKFLKKLNTILKNSGIDYDVKTLDETVKNLKKSIKQKIDELLDNRKNNICAEIRKDSRESDNLFRTIDEQTEVLKSELEILINQLIYSELQNEIFSLYTFKSEEQKEKISEALEKFDSVLTLNVLESLSHRNGSLKNMMRETYAKVTELNEKTIEINSELTPDKVMKKEVA